MKSLDKAQTAEKENLIKDIRDAHEALEKAVEVYNGILDNAKSAVETALETLNEKVSDAENWLGSITYDMQAYYEEKSERWQEGEKGQQYAAWKEEYEGITVAEVDIEFPDSLEMPECDVADELDNLPDEP